MDIKLHKGDLLSVVVSTCRLDHKFARRLLHFCQGPLMLAFFMNYISMWLYKHAALPEMTPLKVLTLARCMASSPNDGDLFKVAKQLQFCNEVRRGSFHKVDAICLVNLIKDVTVHCRIPVRCIRGWRTAGYCHQSLIIC